MNTDRIVESIFVIGSGRGLYVIWKIEDVLGIYKQTKSLYKHIPQYIYKLFKDVGADPSAKDIARVLRVPNFISKQTWYVNTKLDNFLKVCPFIVNWTLIV